MDKIKNYDVQFSGLKEREHQFSFEIKQSFFDLFTFEQDFQNPNLKIELNLNKKSTFLELNLRAEGLVTLICDITNEPYQQSIKGTMDVLVKFGDEYDDSDDEVLVIPHGDYKINIAQLIFELVLLNIPLKHVRPDIDTEEMLEALELLEEYEPHAQEENLEEEVNEKDNDPRWDKLKKLLDNN